jgi:arylsulfatase A-like enzyme
MSPMNRRDFLRLTGAAAAAALPGCLLAADRTAGAKRPNIVYIMTDDHASHAISAYGSKINKTPHIDRLAREGMLFANCFCTNSLCGPSRATLLTGKFSHKHRFFQNGDKFDGSQQTLPKLLGAAGYQTAVIGKWHLESDPTGFDYWNILPGQGAYHDPVFIDMGERKKHTGYVTDLITDFTMQWIKGRDKTRPFCVLCHHKAPHREWNPDEKHAAMYEGQDVPEPETFNDDYSGRSAAAAEAEMRMSHLGNRDTKGPPPEGLEGEALKKWKYQRYIKDYLRCIASVDDNVGRLLDFLDAEGLAANTIVVYTSDQGFYLGDHGWFDKRFIYDHSLRMPYIVRYPPEVKPGTTCDALAQNIDFAPTFLDYAGAAIPEDIQGASLRPLYRGQTPADWREAVYYHYYEYPAVHMVKRHYGCRTKRYKLAHFYYDIDAWELFDLEKDPNELKSVYDDPACADVRAKMHALLDGLRKKYGDDHDPFDDVPPRRRAAAAGPPATGPQLVLAFEDPADAKEAADASGGARNLVYHGTQPADGRKNKGRRFDGNKDFADLAGNLCPKPRGTPVTVSAWVRPDKADGVILAHGGVSLGYALYLSQGKAAFAVRVGGSLTAAVAPQKLADGFVHVAGHLAADGTVTVFVGGQPAATAKADGLLGGDPADNLQVGVDNGSKILEKDAGNFGGVLDELRVIYGPLAPADISALAAP